MRPFPRVRLLSPVPPPRRDDIVDVMILSMRFKHLGDISTDCARLHADGGGTTNTTMPEDRFWNAVPA